MNKEKRSVIIREYLKNLYPNPDIPLYHDDPFTLLVAVVLSAQCTDKKVNEITPSLFKMANDPQKMVTLGQVNILSLIKQIGLANQKSKNIYKLSKLILDEYNGKVPSTFKELETLPGVGHKTASVVMAQAFGFPTFPVDTHIHRLAQRWELTTGENVLRTESDLKKLFPISEWNNLHLQIIYYGREHCTARGCDGRSCGLCKTLFPKRQHPVKWIRP